MYFVVEGGGGVACFGILYEVASGGSQGVGGIFCQQRGLNDGISMDAQAGCMRPVDVVYSIRVVEGGTGGKLGQCDSGGRDEGGHHEGRGRFLRCKGCICRVRDTMEGMLLLLLSQSCVLKRLAWTDLPWIARQWQNNHDESAYEGTDGPC